MSPVLSFLSMAALGSPNRSLPEFGENSYV